MNKLITLSLLLISLQSRASNVMLAWDASTTAGVTNYMLYASTNTLNATNLSTALVIRPAGNNLNAFITGINSARWFFVVTTIKDGQESLPSNLVIYDVPSIPAVPANARTVAIQYGVSLGTNRENVGFFWLQFQ